MKPSSPFVFSAVSFFLCIVLSGCLGGKVTSDTVPVPNRDIGMTFSCNSFDFQDNGTLDTLDEPIGFIDKSKISQAAVRKYPSIFGKGTSRQTPVPIAIRMTQRPEDLGSLGWVIYPQAIWLAGSLGILPVYFPVHDFIYDIEVDFNSIWGKKIFSAKTSLVLHENYWLGSCPFFYAFYSNGKIAADAKQRILEFTGGAGKFNRMKGDFIADSITDSVVRLILANRKNLTLKILLSEVENRWGIVSGYETGNALYAADDAKSISRWLVGKSWNRSRIKTLSGKGVTKNNLEGALENFLGNAKNNDIVLLFVSGEIYRDPKRPDDVYLIGADTNRDEVWTGCKISDMFSSLKEARTSNVVIIFDVCRKPRSNPILTENYLRRLEPLPGWLIISNETTGRAEESSLGPLTKLILNCGKADADGDGIISLRELSSWLLDRGGLHGLTVIRPSSSDSRLLDYTLSNE